MDMEKVIKGLQECNLNGGRVGNCPYKDSILATIQELMDRMIPKEKEVEGGGTTWWMVCPECHGAVDQLDHFCRHCGQAL